MFNCKLLIISLLVAGNFFVSFTVAQQWTSQFLNLFSENFRNFFHQFPTSQIPMISPNSLDSHTAAASFFSLNKPIQSLPTNKLSSPVLNNYKYSQPKDEILQYSDEDSSNRQSILSNSINTIQNQEKQNSVYLSSYNNMPAYNSFSDNNPHTNNQIDTNQSPSKAQFDDEPLFSFWPVAQLSNKRKKKFVNKNIDWDDFPDSGLNINEYNLDNLYNNHLNYNRLPAIPEHVIVSPSPSTLPTDLSSRKINLPSLASNPFEYQKNNHIYSGARNNHELKNTQNFNFQSSGNINNRVNNVNKNKYDSNFLTSSTTYSSPSSFFSLNTSPKTAYSSFLAKPKLSNFNLNSVIPNESNEQVFSENLVKQQYEKAKPKFDLIQPNENYLVKQKTFNYKTLENKDSSNYKLSYNHQKEISSAYLSPNSLEQNSYKIFETTRFANSHLKNPSVMYYDNQITHHFASSPQTTLTPKISSINTEKVLSISNQKTDLINELVPFKNIDKNYDQQMTTPLSVVIDNLKLSEKSLLNPAEKSKKKSKVRKIRKNTNYGARRRKDVLEAVE